MLHKKPTHPKMAPPTNRKDRLSPQQGDEPQPDQEGQDGNAAAEQEQNDTTQDQEGQAQEGQSGESDAPTGQEQALTPEEAQRYLDALDPDRPPTRKRARKGRRSRKDW